jgi:hypothetical protein
MILQWNMRSQYHKPSEPSAKPSRTVFHIIDAVTIGAMVGVGVYWGSVDDLYKTVGVDGPTASSARIGAVSNQDRSRP